MFKSLVFRIWFGVALAVWVALFATFNSLDFLAGHFHYPAIMVLGAFVAGLTPEGGGAVAFPVLSVFFEIDRAMARDFSLMIQSIGMTSASIFILSNRANVPSRYKPLLQCMPFTFLGFVAGMHWLQDMPIYIIQALFLALITTFTIAYATSNHRGERDDLVLAGPADFVLFAGVLFIGGMVASLFGTGTDIVLYTLLVTRLRMKEKVATQMSIIAMAGMSVLGYAYRGLYNQNVTQYQVQTWLCAYPVVLFMAPFGTYVLSKIDVSWMLKGVVVLNVGQLAYFNLNKPSLEKSIASAVFCVILMALFSSLLRKMEKSKAEQAALAALQAQAPALAGAGRISTAS